jgi:hypothetical protein
MFARMTAATFPGWACALLLLTAPGAAAVASCGDWLAHAPQASNLDRQQVNARLHTFDTRADRTIVGLDRDSKRSPCRGPHCRQAPEQPQTPIPSSISFDGEKTVLATHAFWSGADDQCSSARNKSRVHPLRGFFPGLDHPPRVS